MNSLPLRGCVFDFDGTIIVSEHIHMRAWEDLAAAENRDLPSDFLERSVGMSDIQLVKILATTWGAGLSEREIITKKRDFYMTRCVHECQAVPGVVTVIKSLNSREVPMALATSSSRDEVMPVLDRLGITSCFRKILTVEDVRNPKPDPEIYIKAAAGLSLLPQECLAFEDSQAGVLSARSAGCQMVTIQTLYAADKLGAAVLSIKDFTDDRLVDLLSGILA